MTGKGQAEPPHGSHRLLIERPQYVVEDFRATEMRGNMQSQPNYSWRILGVMALGALALCAAFLLFAVLWWIVPGPVVGA